MHVSAPYGVLQAAKNIFIIFRNTPLTGCGAAWKWTVLVCVIFCCVCHWISVSPDSVHMFKLLVARHFMPDKIYRSNTLKVCSQLFEKYYLSNWVQPTAVTVITKSLCLQDNDKFPVEQRFCKRQCWYLRCHTQKLWMCLCFKSNSLPVCVDPAKHLLIWWGKVWSLSAACVWNFWGLQTNLKPADHKLFNRGEGSLLASDYQVPAKLAEKQRLCWVNELLLKSSVVQLVRPFSSLCL